MPIRCLTIPSPVWSEKMKSVTSWNAQLQERCAECVLSNKVSSFGVASVSVISLLNAPYLQFRPLLNRPKLLDMRTSSQILLLAQPEKTEDPAAFFPDQQHQSRKRRLLSSAYLASSAEFSELPKHMGHGRCSVLLVRLPFYF